jgi:hypothetical protein
VSTLPDPPPGRPPPLTAGTVVPTTSGGLPGRKIHSVRHQWSLRCRS